MVPRPDFNRVMRTLPSPDTNGGDFVVDSYGRVWRVLPAGQSASADGTCDRRGTLHSDGRITEP